MVNLAYGGAVTSVVPPIEGAFRFPSFLTPEEFAAGTGGKVAATDPRIEPLLAGASAGVRRYCGWHIGPVVDETLELDGPGSPVLMVPTGRLVSVLNVVNGGYYFDADALQRLEWSRHGMVKLPGNWSSKFGGVSIRVRHGWDLADIADVVQIVQQVTANALASPMGATREQAGQVSISWAMTAPNVSGGLSLLERDLGVLNNYKI